MQSGPKKEKSRVITKKELITFENTIDELRDLEKMLNRYADPNSFIRDIQKDNPRISEKYIWDRFKNLKTEIEYFTNKIKMGSGKRKGGRRSKSSKRTSRKKHANERLENDLKVKI